jgi:hypothetical protein
MEETVGVAKLANIHMVFIDNRAGLNKYSDWD